MTDITFEEPKTLSKEERQKKEELAALAAEKHWSQTPDQLFKDALHGYSRPEIEQITGLIKAHHRFDRRVQLVLSIEEIYGNMLLAYGAENPEPAVRSPEGGRDYAIAWASALAAGKSYGSYPPRPFIRDLPCAVGNVSLDMGAIGNLTPVVDPANIVAAQQLAFITTVGDGLRVFAAGEALVQRWAAEAYDFGDEELSDFLYCRWRRNGDLTQTDRQVLTAGRFGFPVTGLPAGAVVNREFPGQFTRLITLIQQYYDNRHTFQPPSPPSRSAVNLAATQVRWNIQQHMSEATILKIKELRDRLDNELALLGHEKVIQKVAGGHPDGIWAVVRALLDGNGRPTPDVVALYQQAVARNTVFTWLTKVPGESDQTEFDNAVDAGELFRATALPSGNGAVRPEVLSAVGS